MTNPGPSKLVGYWSMDEESGVRLDSHGSHDLTPENNPLYEAGKQGKAASFISASEQGLGVADHVDFSIGALSFCVGFWFKPNDIQQDNTRLLAKWIQSGAEAEKEYRIFLSSSKIVFGTYESIYEINVTANNFGTLTNGIWYFVYAYYDYDAQKIFVSVNDVSDIENGPLTIEDGSNALYFGRETDTDQSYYFLDGLIDEAFFYKGRLLNAAEQTWMYNSGAGRIYSELLNANPGLTDLIAYWRMDERSGTRFDSHGTNHCAIVENAPGYGVGRRGKALNLIAGDEQAVGVSNRASIRMGNNESFEIGLWFKVYSLTTNMKLMGKYSTSFPEYMLGIYNSKVRFLHTDQAGTTFYSIDADSFGILSKDTWYFATGGYDEVTDQMFVSVNDIYDSEVSSANGARGSINTFYFGRSPGTNYFLNGLADEAFLYKDRILTIGERTWLYNLGYGRTYSEISSISPPPISVVTAPTAGKLSISVLDFSLNVIAIIEDYYSLTWAERYFQAGDFELDLPIEYTENTVIDFGNFLYIKSSDKLMVIEDMKPSFAEDKSSLIVKGQSAENLIGQRVLLDPINVSGRAEICIFSFIENHITDPDDSDRAMALFRTEFSEMLTTVLYEEQFEMQSIYNVIETICKGTSLGFKVVMYNDELVFYVYEGVDRSYDQSTNPYVIFADDFDNVIASSFYESEKDKVNIVLVATKDNVPALQRVFVWESSKPTGMDRHEKFLETEIERLIGETGEAEEEDTELATPTLGISGKVCLAAIGIVTNPVMEISTYVPPLSDVEVLAIITTRGKQVIEEEKIVGIFEGDFDIQGNFKYGEDFFMGDVVQCNLEGRNVKARIIELVRSYSTEGETSYVAMDFII